MSLLVSKSHINFHDIIVLVNNQTALKLCECNGVLLLQFSAVFNSLRTPVKTARSWLVWRGLMVIYLLNNITTIVSEHDWNCSVWSAWKCYETSNVILIYVNMICFNGSWRNPCLHELELEIFSKWCVSWIHRASAWDVGISLAGSNWLSRRSVLSVMFQFPILFVDSKF